MLVLFDRSFSKSLDKVKLKRVKSQILSFIEDCENANVIQDLKSVRKLKGYKSYYRYRFGDYRIGFELTEEGKIVLIIVAKRNDIYKKFP